MEKVMIINNVVDVFKLCISTKKALQPVNIKGKVRANMRVIFRRNDISNDSGKFLM